MKREKYTYMMWLRNIYDRFAWRDITEPVTFGEHEADDITECIARAGKLIEDTGLDIDRNYSVAEIADIRKAIASLMGR